MHESIDAEAEVALAGQLPFPRVVELQTTTVCNARCCTCPYDSVYGSKAGSRMSDELLWRLLRECKANAGKLNLVVPYHNNEPFADTRIYDVLRYISDEIGVATEISTNGSLISTEEKAERLVSAMGKGALRISYFGGAKEQYEARMARLNWEVANRNIERILLARARKNSTFAVEIIMIAHAGLTEREVNDTRERWEPLGAKVFVFGYLDRAGNMQSSNVLPILRKRGRLIACDLNRPFDRINITAPGQAILCSQDWRAEVVLGDLRENSISEVWNGKEYQRIRSQLSGAEHAPNELICRSCKIAVFE